MSDMSARQRDCWAWAACLAPAVTILPAAAARAGAGGWIAPVLVLPVLWAVDCLLRRVGTGGLARGSCAVLGKWGGRILTIIYIMWAVLLGAMQLRVGAGRVEAVAALPVEPWMLWAGIVLLALWMARGKPAACARWAVIVFGGLLAVLSAISLLALRQMRWDNLLPLWDGGEKLPGAIAVTLAILCVRVYSAFLPGVEAQRAKRYPALVCLLLSGLLLTIQGNLGTPLAARLEDPLLTLCRNVGVEGAFQRAESLLAAVLLLADLALLTLLLWAMRLAAGQAWPTCSGGHVAAGIGLGMFAAASLPICTQQTEMLRYRIVPAGNFVLGVVVPLVLLAIERVKGQKQGAYLVPGNEENSTY